MWPILTNCLSCKMDLYRPSYSCFSAFQTQTKLHQPALLGLQFSDSKQIVGHLSFHNGMSQFLILNIFLHMYSVISVSVLPRCKHILFLFLELVVNGRYNWGNKSIWKIFQVIIPITMITIKFDFVSISLHTFRKSCCIFIISHEKFSLESESVKAKSKNNDFNF